MESNEAYELTKEQNDEDRELEKKDVNQSESHPSMRSDSGTTGVNLQKKQIDFEKESKTENESGDLISSKTNNLEVNCKNDTALQSEQPLNNSVNNEQIDLEKESNIENENGNLISCKTNILEVDCKNDSVLQNEQLPNNTVLCDSTDSSAKKNETNHNNEKFSQVIVNTSKPLCADYQSDSDCESVDSESDSSTSTDTSTEACSSSEYESDDSNNSSTAKNKSGKGGKKLKGELSLMDLPPIESLKISVPEDACVEIGKISSIVETLVIVESYKGTAALDIDTILFLDCGRQTLGKVFDILGPVTEPVYAVRFNSHEQIKSLGIQKDRKVYYAPKTEHTTFVFMSEVLKNRGSDASWKDNTEAPPEFQDFSDDEEERRHKNKKSREIDGDNNSNQPDQNKSRKRSFNKSKQTPGALQGSRFRNPNFSQPRPYFPRNGSVSQFGGPPTFPRSNFPNPVQIPPFPYNVPAYPSTNPPLSRPPHLLFPQRIPFPTFPGLAYVNQSQNFQQPFFQQRTHAAFPQVFGAWARPSFRPPPPPPPPADQTDRKAI